MTWLKDVNVGTGLTETRDSNGVTLSTNTDGWVPANETWTYSSSDSPSYTFTVSGDDTSKYSPGMRVKLTQSSTEYFIITAVSYSSPNTTITLYGGTDYTLANATITNPYYSMEKSPYGFPLDPSKWTVRLTSVTNNTQSSPTVGTYYNVNTNFNLTVPIGVWDLRYMVHLYYSGLPGSSTILNLTASTSNNSESDQDLTSGYESNIAETGRVLLIKEKTISLTQKTTYYLNVMLQYGSAGSIGIAGDRNTRNIFEAVSAYL